MPDKKWYASAIADVFEAHGSLPEGLSEKEAASRLRKNGPNELLEKRRASAWMLLLSQFKDVMIIILIAAALVSGIVGDLKDTIVILIIVVLNALVGFIQEYRAQKAMEALKKMAVSQAKVRRNNTRHEVPSTELVVGDIVVLEAGDMVPADLRLVEVHALKIEEASLTGESTPVDKSIEPLKEKASTSLGDRVNMAYKSTLVTYGRGLGIVVATGMNTEIGGIAEMLQGEESTTPLKKRLTDFGKKLSLVVIGICIVLFFIGWMRGEEPVRMLLTALSVAVAAIPEAMPAVVTVSLALGARKMVRKHALIRKLPAVETLGSVTYICTDKTGTLTQNRMDVQEIWTANSSVDEALGLEAEDLLILSMAANQDSKVTKKGRRSGDPTEIALANFATQHERFQADWKMKFPRIHELPFDSERKMMTTVHKAGAGYLIITKGAVESLLKVCAQKGQKKIEQQAEAYAVEGMRVLAYACKYVDQDPSNLPPEKIESGLEFCGLAGMIDPPRPEAKKAVAECIAAGIIPVMITGDHPATARAIAMAIGILREDSDRVITGQELAAMKPKTFHKEIEQIKVYARVSPEQKLLIVTTLQDKNQYVAMTGDGVNDAPALQRANIGIAMGITGSDVSKEAAHMILLDDNFATIVKAVKEGRRIYDNIRKFIKYILAGNCGEIWAIVLAPVFGLPIPLLPIHILYINLVTDGLPGLALVNEPVEKNIMQRPPRPPGENIFAQGLGWHILWVGLLMGSVCLVLQAWAINQGKDHWQTMVFTVLCLSQMGHVLAIRSDGLLLFRLGFFTNMPLLGSVLLTFALQLIIIYVPFCQEIFATKPLSWQELGLCILLSVVVFHAVELEKIIKRKVHAKR